jgi:uncharacterized protein YdiU (UPF0061 family)
MVSNPDEYQGAGVFLKGVKVLLGKIAETFDPVIDQAHKAHKTACAAKKQYTEPLEAAERVVKSKMGTFISQEETKRREQEDRLRREAIERSQAAQLQAAVDAEERGEKDVAEAILDARPMAPIVKVDRSDLKVEGVSKVTIWRFRIVNPKLIPREFLIPDEKAIGAVVRQSREATSIPGIEVYPEESVRMTTR